jgi:hypothetical protein
MMSVSNVRYWHKADISVVIIRLRIAADRQGAWFEGARFDAIARRRGDRITPVSAAAQNVCYTKQTLHG